MIKHSSTPPIPTSRSAKCSAVALALWCFCSLFAAPYVEASRGEARIEKLLAKARAALAADRLSVPAGDNAILYAQQVLDLVPRHSGAFAVLQAVVSRYADLSEASLQRGIMAMRRETRNAGDLQKRGMEIGNRYQLTEERLTQTEQRITEAKQTDGSKACALVGNAEGESAVAKLVEQYIRRSEIASGEGNLIATNRYASVARELIADVGTAQHPKFKALQSRLDRVMLAAKNIETGTKEKGCSDETSACTDRKPTQRDYPNPITFMPPAL